MKQYRLQICKAVRLEYIRKIKVFFCIRLLKYTGSAKNYLSTFEKEGDALDVVIKILKIPGVLQRNYPGTTHDRVNECIGKIFNLKMEKLIV